MSRLFGQFSEETLESIAATQFKTVPKGKKHIISDLTDEAESAGVKELVFMLSNMELDDVCNRYLKVEHAPGNNTKAKMVLTKRLMESFEDKGLEDWFESCNDKIVLGALCERLGLDFNPKSSMDNIKSAAIKEIRNYGAQILFSRLSVDQLKCCCEEMGLEGWETSNSKRALIAAIITQSAVIKAPAPKAKVITKKVAIEKCTTYDELYQHYSAKALEFWCEKNSLKTYGTKKDLINRILEHLSGDKENVVVVPADKLPKSSKAKTTKPKKSDDDDMEDVEVVKPSSTRTRGAKKPAAKPVKGKKSADDQPADDEPADDEPVDEPAPVKEAPKPKAKPVKGKKATRVEEPADDEPAPADEPADDVYDADAEQRAIDAERALRTTEEQERTSEESELDIQESESDEDHPKSLAGLRVHINSKCSIDLETAEKAITKAGGIYSAKFAKSVDIFVTSASGVAKARAQIAKQIPNCKVVDESYLRNIL
jgi:hypothetical protein